MAVQIGISRRRALEMTIAMGGLAMAGGTGHAQTPPTPKIEQLAPELEKIIATSEPIQHLADGFGGTLGPAEGPLWWKEGKYLLFSDIHNNKRMSRRNLPFTRPSSRRIRARQGRVRVPRADQPGQWLDPRPAGPLARLRARFPTDHPP
jgi:hypothetical protein